MKLYLWLLLSISMLLTLTSCSESDPCDDIVCVNGECINGNCDCDTGYTGSDCSVEQTPSTIDIILTLNSCPGVGVGGAPWDLLDGPDIFLEFNAEGGGDYTRTQTRLNHNCIDPIVFESVKLRFPQLRYNFTLIDEDNLANDIMGQFTFVPYESGGGFPPRSVFDNSGFEFTLDFNYNF